MLETNSKKNKISFVLERLDKVGFYNQFDYPKVVFNANDYYYYDF